MLQAPASRILDLLAASGPLAWRQTTASRSKLVRSAAGIGFAVLLMLTELGFRVGFLESALQLVRDLDADLIVVDATLYHMDGETLFPRRRLQQASSVRGVASARPLYLERNVALWRNPHDMKTYTVQAFGFDPDAPVLLLNDVNTRLQQLRRPDTVMVDRRARDFLGMDGTPAETELGYHHVQILGAFALGPNFIDDGTVFLSDRTFMTIFPTRDGRELVHPDIDLGIIKVAPGFDPRDVKQRLTRELPNDVVVLTKGELLEIETRFQSTVSPVGPIFGLGTLIGFGVGILITYQILYNDLSDQLPQYATLKAMGYSSQYIIVVVLQQAMLYALAAFIPAWLLAILLYRTVAELSLLPLEMTSGLTTLGFCFTIGMCAFAGLVAARRVLSADPADVF